MYPIVAPINPGDQNPNIANLQTALLTLLQRQLIKIEPEYRARLINFITQEQSTQSYQEATKETVAYFQGQYGFNRSGEVDERTADALNNLLREWGLLDREGVAALWIVTGTVRREDGLPFPAVRVRATHQGQSVPIRLGEDTTDVEGRYTIHYESLPGSGHCEIRGVRSDHH